MMNAIYIPADVTMNFEVGSGFDKATGSKYIFVDGKLVDNDEILDDYTGVIYY